MFQVNKSVIQSAMVFIFQPIHKNLNLMHGISVSTTVWLRSETDCAMSESGDTGIDIGER